MGANMSRTWTSIFPPKPSFDEKNVGDLKDKVYIVTGSNTGIGKELARMLYTRNANIYIAARSQERAERAMQDIRAAAPSSKGTLSFLRLDLGDLRTIKATADEFLSKEKKLHVLFNNAGVQALDGGSTAQGYESNLGVNCVGVFAFTKLLTPTLVETARTEPQGAVRVVWVSSLGTELLGLKSVGVDMENLDYKKKNESGLVKYGLSKAGNWLQGVEFAKRLRASGVVGVPLNPGNIASDLYRDQSWIMKLSLKAMTYPNAYGACTEFYAGLSQDITLEKTGQWVIPFGRLGSIRPDLLEATKSKTEGGNDTAAKFWEWCEEQVKDYV